jgi:CheY-like chemotaxis protein
MMLPRLGGSLRVLVVDDDAAVADAIVQVLRLAGYRAAAADDGVRAVDVTRDFRPDVVLLNVDDPDRDAVAAAAKLRANAISPAPVIMAVASFLDADLTKRLSGSGIAGAWAKPVDGKSMHEFLAELQTVLDSPPARPTPRPK